MVWASALTSSSGRQVRTSAVMISVTGADNRSAPRAGSARTTSRSLTIPLTPRPSSLTTTAPMLCSASTDSNSATFAELPRVTTALPL